MTETHEVSVQHQQYAHRILEEAEAGWTVSQRALSKRVGIALGLTNLLLRRMVKKGLLRVVRIKPNRVSYLITPAGIAEKARMSRDFLAYSVAFYANARDRLVGRLGTLSAEFPKGTPSGDKRIVFFGAGEVAEIGYICLQSTDLRLVGVVDHTARPPFFGFPVRPPAELQPGVLAGVPFDRLVCMVFTGAEPTRATLDAIDYPATSVFWV